MAKGCLKRDCCDIAISLVPILDPPCNMEEQYNTAAITAERHAMQIAQVKNQDL